MLITLGLNAADRKMVKAVDASSFWWDRWSPREECHNGFLLRETAPGVIETYRNNVHGEPIKGEDGKPIKCETIGPCPCKGL